MNKIAGQLMLYRDDVEVGLLMGSICTRAIVPREVTPGILDEPYALRRIWVGHSWKSQLVSRLRWRRIWCHKPDHYP